MMQMILAFCGTIAIIILLLFSIILWRAYSVDRSDSSLKITFKSFKSWYYLNPERYVFKGNKILLYDDSSNSYILEMKNFFEYIKYEIFLDALYKKEEKTKLVRLERENIHNQLKILSVIQSDIDAVKLKAEEMIRKNLL